MNRTALLLFSLTLLGFSCGGGSSTSTYSVDAQNLWTWISGSSTVDNLGVYGPELVAVPGGRDESISWVDSAGNLWLFGGSGMDDNGQFPGVLNDLWRFDGTYWTWVSGSTRTFFPNPYGVYGSMGSPASSNIPGGRSESISWLDLDGNMWLFGGNGLDEFSRAGYLNDLWRFDGTYWTWMSGSSTHSAPGVYGTMGSPASSNVPGGRYQSISWVDPDGDLWLFGGYGDDESGGNSLLNDLWRFDGTYWTWMSGSKTIDSPAFYGIKGLPAASNVPGARHQSVSWVDANGYLWLFGGSGRDEAGSYGYLGDLWRFDGTYWTWMSGSKIQYAPGVYGTKGSPDSTNIPGARFRSVSWVDPAGDLWLFGGAGLDGSGGNGRLNDLWRFDGTYWTWVSGSNTIDGPAFYGTMGSPATSNVPGARTLSISWVDPDGNLWLFGGSGRDEAGDSGALNDLWRYIPE